jgi:hypothetical protein
MKVTLNDEKAIKQENLTKPMCANVKKCIESHKEKHLLSKKSLPKP